MKTTYIIAFSIIGLLALSGLIGMPTQPTAECDQWYTWEAQLSDGSSKTVQTPHISCFEAMED